MTPMPTPPLSLNAEPLTLTLKTPFRIAHGTSTQRTNLLVRFGDALGEGALPPYYGLSLEDARAYVRGLDAALLHDPGPLALERVLGRLPAGPAPARAAVDIALHDHWGRQLGHPLARLWGLDPSDAPLSSFTLSIPDDLNALRKALRAAESFPVLKLKLGTGDVRRDEAIVRTAREATAARLCVDANGAWSIDEAAALIPRLAGYDLLFVEEPVQRGGPAAWHRLRQALPPAMPPLIADESVQGPADILALRGAADGINVKLAKAGGLRAARQWITLARALDLSVLVGCMVESAVAVTAAAHLAPLADFADLDAGLLLAHDPFSGMVLERGRIHLPDGPGLGVGSRAENEGRSAP